MSRISPQYSPIVDCVRHSLVGKLLHWGQDKMADILQTTFCNSFCCMKFEFVIFWFKFHWRVPKGSFNNSMVLNRHQAIIWTNDGLVHWCIYGPKSVISSWYRNGWVDHNNWSSLEALTHWGWDKMAAISQTTFSNAFSSMKIFESWFKFHWSLFLRVQLTIFQHWFRKWLGAGQAPNHYLNQCRLNLMTDIWVTRYQWVKGHFNDSL